MSLYDQYKPGLDRLFAESMSQLMVEEEFYEKSKNKFDALENEIEDFNTVKAHEVLQKSIISKIQKVHNRVLLIRDLRIRIENADDLIQVVMYPGLITYLYLTCFDQMGTPSKGWRFFPNWIESRKHRVEVEEIVEEARGKFEANSLDGIKSIGKDIYNGYHLLYGVKNSFFRFIREVIPADSKANLLNSILVEKWDNEGNQVMDFEVDDSFKEKGS